MPMPLHPGALRYYQEVGLLGPDASLEVALAENVRDAETAAYSPNGALKVNTNVVATTAPAAPADDDAGKTFVVYFGLNEKDVGGEAMQELAEVSAYADNLTTAHISISGHTDRSGDPVYNQYLAEIRAKAVVNALRETYGIGGHEIEMLTHGSSAPAVNDNREYQPQNRRVEITVTPADGAAEPQQVENPGSGDTPTSEDWEKRASI
jgi:outer membrane protein OmpA-like peptidoglycan-associated protein